MGDAGLVLSKARRTHRVALPVRHEPQVWHGVPACRRSGLCACRQRDGRHRGREAQLRAHQGGRDAADGHAGPLELPGAAGLLPYNIPNNNKFLKEKKVGDKVSVAGTNIVDASSCSVTVFVLSPNEILTRVTANSFEANRRGEYTVFYYVADEYANVTVVQYTVKVS